MGAFLSAKNRFAVHLRPEDVHAAPAPEHRPAELDAVVKALDSLVEWGNLRADPDTSRVTDRDDAVWLRPPPLDREGRCVGRPELAG